MNKIIVNNPKNVINSKIGKNYFKLVGTGGPKGDKGDKGDTGTAATISAGTASSLPAGSSPTVTNSGTSSAAVFNFGIPKGDKGDKGDTGATGAAATITVGSTTTGAAGTNASVTNSGTSGAAVLNFSIPRGDKGETGATGATGATGQAATVAVGSTTTLAPGSSATVTNSGTSSAATFNFGIPQGVKGDTGSVKSAYVTSLPSTGNENTYYLNGDTATTGSVSGTAVQITNADNTGEISDFKLNGNTEQTTYTGKNLVNQISIGNSTWHGLTTTASSESVRFSGTTDNNYPSWIFYADGYMLKDNWYPTASSVYTPRGQFCDSSPHTLTIRVTGNSVRFQTIAFFVGYMDGTFSGNQFVPEGQNVATYSTNKAVNYIAVGFKGGNVSFDNTLQIQFEAGSTATTFEPYVGGIASPNPDYPQAVNVVTGEQTVKVAGKNLLPTITGSDTYSGVSLTSNNGTITATGTATANMTFTLTGTDGIKYRQTYWQTILATTTNSVLIPKGTYYFSGTATLGNITIQYRLVDIGQKLEDGTSISLNSSITLTEDKWLCIAIYVNNTRTPDVNMSALQLELGNQATTYEAFRGTDYEVNLGKNLLNITSATGYIFSSGLPDVTSSAITVNDFDSNMIDFTIPSSGGYLMAMTNTFKLKPNTKYDISFKRQTTLTNNQTFVYGVNNGTYSILYRDNNGGALRATFTTPANGLVCIAFGSGLASGSATISDIQIEEGSATTFAPYFTPIELCKIGTYQDYIWNDNGTWKIHKAVGKVVLNGSEANWTYYFSTVGIYNCPNTFPLAMSAFDDVICVCDYYTAVTRTAIRNNLGTADNVCAVHSNEMVIANKAISTVNDFKTWLGTHNTTIYYALATPTDTAITESALITQLDNLVSAELLSGVNNIMLVPANQPNGSMSIDYTTWDKHDRYDVYIWNDTIGDYQLIHAGGGNN